MTIASLYVTADMRLVFLSTLSIPDHEIQLNMQLFTINIPFFKNYLFVRGFKLFFKKLVIDI